MTKAENLITEVNRIVRNREKAKQIAKITKLWKYRFGWSRSTAFKYILKSCPEVEPDVPAESIKNSNLTQLYAALNKAQLSKVIQRLEFIEKRNDSAAAGEVLE